MGKRLVSEKGVEELVVDGNFYMEGVILTPGAKDVLRNKGVTIVYGPRPEASETESGDALAETIATLLVKEYGITDEAKVKTICSKVLSMIE